MGIEETRILSENQFNISPDRFKFKSYDDYLNHAFSGLYTTDIYTFYKNAVQEKAQEISENIQGDIEGFYLEKEQEKATAEEQYNLAMNQYHTARKDYGKYLTAQMDALRKYGENSKQHLTALANLNNFKSNDLFKANLYADIAHDRLNRANFSTWYAYLSTRHPS